MDTIPFSTNWNNKLFCNYFTTIRPKSHKYIVGNKYSIVSPVKTNPRFEATIVKILEFSFDNLNDILLVLDTGYLPNEAKEIIKKMYPSNYNQLKYYWLLLKRIE
jgi:hypothetical protein